ncbi:MAG: hypothetical protein FWE34_05700 [Defluviitaleaceae bacterium]|nr:hypothetical protein [Defluviitaleaceae bacterium]
MLDFYKKWDNVTFATLALGIMLSILFLGYNVGMSDQSDFGRVMDASSLTHYVHDRAFIFIDRYTIILEPNSLLSNAWRIMFSEEGIENYPSIHLLFVRLSVVANLFINRIIGAPLDVYRIGILGGMTAVMYAALLYWLFRQIRLQNPILDIIAKLVIIFIAVDVGYIAYFNSFFSESIQILAFMMLVVSGIRIFRGHTHPLDFVWLVLASLIFGWSKFVNIPIAFIMIAVFAVIVIFSADVGYRLRRGIIIGVIALAGLVPLMLVYNAIPDWMDIDTNYNSVFFGIVKDVDDATARRHLQSLGLSPDMAQFASTNRYVAGAAPLFRELGFEEEFENISKMDLLLFYLRHPALLWANIEMSIAHSGMIRPWYIANYGHQAERLTPSDNFSGWSWLRVRMAFDTMWGSIILWLAFAAAFLTKAIAYLSHNGRRMAIALLLAILGSAAYSVVVQMIANGEADLAKHMFVYIQFADFAFVALIVGLLYHIDENPKTLRLAELKALHNIPRFAVPIICIIALTVPLLVSSIRAILPITITPIDTARQGDIVTFGEFGSQDLQWLVIDETADALTLFAIQDVAQLPFDSGNSSFWVESDIREWLNNDFLNEVFNDTYRIVNAERDLLLSIRTQELATSGDRDFYAFHIPRYAFRGADRAYSMVVADYVRLPGADTMQTLYDMGSSHYIRGGYWLEIPRFLDGEMPRYVTRDGHIIMRDAMNSAGIRPVIIITR